ncbi:MAG: DUF2793 domain-containing protein [Alphaproteobacteria bacterium]|nr:DUF2793 domain-containing protein [Alphaproteobacteria bacterium]
MDSTHLKLPFLAAAQAQKHVTVNESLRRLDILVHMQVTAFGRNAPPSRPNEGDGYGLGSSPSGVWAGKANQLAFYQDKAWVFLVPKEGWRVWDKTNNRLSVWTGRTWLSIQGSTTQQTTQQSSSVSSTRLLPEGMRMRTLQIDHTITRGTYNNTRLIIPDRALVLGVTGRVISSLTSYMRWHLGVPAGITRYGTQIGGSVGSTVIGVSSQPVAYYGNTAIRITGHGRSLYSGRIRLKLYILEVSLPTP